MRGAMISAIPRSAPREPSPGRSDAQVPRVRTVARVTGSIISESRIRRGHLRRAVVAAAGRYVWAVLFDEHACRLRPARRGAGIARPRLAGRRLGPASATRRLTAATAAGQSSAPSAPSASATA